MMLATTSEATHSPDDNHVRQLAAGTPCTPFIRCTADAPPMCSRFGDNSTVYLESHPSPLSLPPQAQPYSTTSLAAVSASLQQRREQQQQSIASLDVLMHSIAPFFYSPPGADDAHRTFDFSPPMPMTMTMEADAFSSTIVSPQPFPFDAAQPLLQYSGATLSDGGPNHILSTLYRLPIVIADYSDAMDAAVGSLGVTRNTSHSSHSSHSSADDSTAPPSPSLSSSSSSSMVPATEKTRQCSKCGVTRTPEWRRARGVDDDGESREITLCNACGLRHARTQRQKRLDSEVATGAPPVTPLQRHIKRERDTADADTAQPRIAAKTKKKAGRGEATLCSMEPGEAVAASTVSEQLGIASQSCACYVVGCGKGFCSTSYVARHSQGHRRPRPFACPRKGCTNTFTQKNNCAKHERRKHGSQS